MDKDRQLAFSILKDVQDNGAWSNLALSSRMEKDSAESPAFVRELVYGCLRNQFLLDYNIDRYLKKPKIHSSARLLLRMGFYQLAFMDSVPDHAAVNSTVALASSIVKGQQGFINAVLRAFQRDGKELRDDGLSTRYSCAQWIVDLWTKSYGEGKAAELLRQSNMPAPLTVRVNTLRISREELKDRLIAQGFEAELTDLSGLCLEVRGSGLLSTKEYKAGLFSVQGEASAAAVEMLAPRAGETMLDLCAAPGGKTCCAAELMKDAGSIRAFDIHQHRVELIKKEAERLGIRSVFAEAADSQIFRPELEGAADCVLADVPCSGLGTLRRNPEIKLREQSFGKASKMLEELSEIQYNILSNAFRYLKSGGRLLYSTCTADPLENEELCARFARENAGCRIEAERQIFPAEGGPDGFYTCLIRRTDDQCRIQDR